MRLNDPIPGIFSQFEQLSPDVIRAQRQAELQNLAEFRARHLQFIKDWSDPVKRAVVQAEHKAAEYQARESLAGQPIDDYRVRSLTGFIGMYPGFTLSETYKVSLKKSWWKRLLDWFR